MPTDVGAILAFWRHSCGNPNINDTAEAVLHLLRRDPEALLLAEEEGRTVGSVIAGWDGWRGHLYRFAVHPDRRREGIGRALLEAAQHRLIAAGCHRADAMVLSDNLPAHGAWTAGGYVLETEWGRWAKTLRADPA